MNAKPYKPLILLLALVMLVSLACSFGGKPTPVATQAPAPAATQETIAQHPAATEAPAATEKAQASEAVAEETQAPEAPVKSGAVSNLEDVEKAVAMVVVEGSYQDPEEGWKINLPRSGTGFFIDPSGILVTNNHVVTGAAQVKVYLNGENKPHNAKVLGVSECADLAVLKVDGKDFPYLEWYPGNLKSGTQVYSAGFPVSAADEMKYSVTDGIISKSSLDLNTEWASIDDGIEHTAKVNPGNSGGPLVNAEGQVIGVNYASNELDQNYSIGRDLAQSVIDQLREGQDVDTIGINGVAVSGDLNGNAVTGIWVRSVKSGSPADKALIQPGDLITELEGQVLTEEANMKDYCSVLRAHNLEDTLSVSVIRSDTMDVLSGQLNGREMAYVSTLEGGSAPGNSGSTETPSDYEAVVDTNASNSGDVYYQDNFDEMVNNWTYDVLYGSEDSVSHGIENGKYRVEITDQNTFVYFYFEGWDFTDVRIDTRAENKGANTNWTGLFCRYSEDGWYEANILSTGEYGIYYYDAHAGANEDPYKRLYSGASRLIKTGKAVNEYTFVCEGNELTLGVNGQEVNTVRIDTGQYPILEKGLVGFTAQSTRITPVILEFDDFILSVP